MEDNKATIVIEEVEDKVTIPLSEYYQLVRAEAVLDMVKGVYDASDELISTYSKTTFMEGVMKVVDKVLCPCKCCEACGEESEDEKEEDKDE